MTEQAEQISYEEVRDPSFLERLISHRSLDLKTCLYFIIATLAIGLAVFQIFVASYGVPNGRVFLAIHLAIMIIFAILLHPLGRRRIADPIIMSGNSDNWRRQLGFAIDMIIIGIVLAIQVWVLYDINDFSFRSGEKEPADLLAGCLMIFVLLEATRRVVGWAMVLIALFFILHTLYANYFFGFFYGPPVGWEKAVDHLFMGSEGIYGIPLRVSATYIVLFIIFGSMLSKSGAGRFFIDLAISLTGHKIGGPAKAAVVASGFMGTISGSAVANVATTGSFTIPLMKKTGYGARYAAAIEACASSGGQITPPIMGAAAFIMAEFLNTSYMSIVFAAIIPALLYFTTIYFMIHLEAEKRGLGRIEKHRLPNTLDLLSKGWHFILAIAIMIYLLMTGFTAMKAAFWGIIAVYALSFLRKSTKMSPVDFLSALESGVRSTVAVSIACGCAGLIIGSIFVSGLGLKFTHEVIELSGGNLIILLILTGISAIILGMGITTTAVYITVAALIVPALNAMGVEPIAAHMYAFYFGVVSSITPPVALASFAAAAISGSGPMETSFESVRIGMAKYIVPFAFVQNPSLLMIGPGWLSLVSTIISLVGFWVLSVGLEGWYRGKITPIFRILIVAAACSIVLVQPNTTFLGVAGYFWELGGVLFTAILLLPRRYNKISKTNPVKTQ